MTAKKIDKTEEKVDDLVESRNEEKIKRLTVDLPASYHNQIKAQCAAEGKYLSDVVREMLFEKFDLE
jgi:hypothetical protein